MKRSKRVEELRKAQKVKLEEVTKNLNKLAKQAAEWFRTTPEEVRRSMSRADYETKTKRTAMKSLMIFKELLEKELIEKKYANEMLYSDVKPYEVLEERTENLYLIREMKCTEKEESKQARFKSFVPGGFCGTFDNSLQEWEVVSDESAPVLRIRRHKDGFFYLNGRRFSISEEPIKHFDFNF